MLNPSSPPASTARSTPAPTNLSLVAPAAAAGSAAAADPGAAKQSFPPPAALVELALARLEAGEPPVRPEAVVPLYMREADATSNFARAARA